MAMQKSNNIVVHNHNVLSLTCSYNYAAQKKLTDIENKEIHLHANAHKINTFSMMLQSDNK